MKRSPKLRGGLFGDDSGTTAILGLLIGGTMFTLTFASVVENSQRQYSVTPQDAANPDLDNEAFMLGLNVLASPGQGWYKKDCLGLAAKSEDFQPEALDRFGLASEPCRGVAARPNSFNISLDKLKNIRDAKQDADAANGLVDYQEAHDSLALKERQFHLRTRVALQDTEAMLRYGQTDPYLRPLYIGDYDEQKGKPGGQVPPKVCGSTPGPNGAKVWIDITNDGTITTVFEVRFILELKKTNVEIVKFSDPVAPQTTVRVWIWLPQTKDWEWKHPTKPEIDILLKDGGGQGVGDCGVDMTGIELVSRVDTRYLLFAKETSLRAQIDAGVTTNLAYVAYTGQGDPYFSATLTLKAEGSLGDLPLVGSLPLESVWTILPPVKERSYNVSLRTVAGATVGNETVHLPRVPLGSYSNPPTPDAYAPNNAVKPEITYLDVLVRDFDPYVFQPEYDSATVHYSAEGDVVPDLKKPLDDQLPKLLVDDRGTPPDNDDVGTLVRYNALIVGSNVAHNVMTSDHAKNSVKLWVEAGGQLVVLGSQEQDAKWLEPLFRAKVEKASGSMAVLDPNHAILNVPNKLSPTAYQDLDRAWTFNSQDADKFTTIVAHGGADIAVSKDGQLGRGRAILTTFRPYNMAGSGPTGPCDPARLGQDCEGLKLLQNFLTLGYDELNVDYGPPIPSDRSVGADTRLVSVFFPRLGESVEVRATVYVW